MKLKRKRNKGIVLITVLLFMVILLGLALTVAKIITLNYKGLTAQNQEFIQFEGADGGIYAVAGWMYFYKRADVPLEVAKTHTYYVEVNILANTVRYPKGYSTAWKGFLAKMNSSSKSTEVESVIFVPVAPAGYGNE